MDQPTTATKFLVDSVKIALPNVLGFGFLHFPFIMMNPFPLVSAEFLMHHMGLDHGSMRNITRWHTLLTYALVHGDIIHFACNFLAFSCCSMYLLPYLKAKLDKKEQESQSKSHSKKSRWKRNIVKSYSKFYKIYFIGTLIAIVGILCEREWRKNELKKELISDNIYTNDEINKYMEAYDRHNNDDLSCGASGAISALMGYISMSSIESILQSIKYVLFDRKKKNEKKTTFVDKKEYSQRFNYNMTQFALQCFFLNLSVVSLKNDIKTWVQDYKYRQSMKKEAGLIAVAGGTHITNVGISAHVAGYISGLICFYCISL